MNDRPPEQQDIEFGAIGFDERRYQIACSVGGSANRLTIITEGSQQEQPATLISRDQTAIIRFVSGTVGKLFKHLDAFPSVRGESTRQRKVCFERAVFDSNSGLYQVFTDMAGKDMLWARKGTHSQFGKAPYTPPEPSEHTIKDPEVALTALENDIVHLLMNGAVTQVRTPETELVERLAHQLQLQPDTAQALLHSTIDKLPHLLPDPAFDVLNIGTGTNAVTVIWTNPAILAAPTASRKRSRRPDIVAVRYPPGHENRVDLPWNFTPGEGLIVNGYRMPLKRDCERLIAALYATTCKDEPAWAYLGDIHRQYSENVQIPDASYKGFVAWANWTFEAINQIAPIVLINNHNRKGRRDRQTLYSFNAEGHWDALQAFTPGTSIETPFDFNIFNKQVTFIDPPSV